MDQSGNLSKLPGHYALFLNTNVSVPDPEESEFITWNLSLVGLPLEDLKVKRPKRGRAHRELRYSILMQLKEVSTKYWIKAWSLRKPEVGCVKPSPRAWTSAPTERNALFTRQEISKSLSESFKLGKGLSRDVGANEDALNLLRDRPQPHCDAYSSHQPSASSLPQKASRKTMQLVEKVATSSNIPGEERLTAVQPSLVSPLDENRLAQTNLLPRRLLIQDRPTPNLLQSSPNSQRDVGPSHRQNTERNVEYSVGPRRNNGGEPQDIYLFPDFKCEYNRPQWLDGDKLRQSQKHISEALIKERRIRTGNRASRSARSGLSSPVPAGPSVNSFVPVNRKTNFAAAVSYLSKVSRKFTNG
jgi:hypothetical protein